jgi:hypothetical protein
VEGRLWTVLLIGCVTRRGASVFPWLPNIDFWEDMRCLLAANYLIYLVGAPRFELGTPSPPDWCANRAALRSEAKEMLGNSLS